MLHFSWKFLRNLLKYNWWYKVKNIIILAISVAVLLIIFIIIVLIIGKNKIRSILTPLDMSKKDINDYLKQKYKVYKEMIKYIKDNLSIREEAFQNFLNFDTRECLQSDLIDMLDKTTYELNEYVDNYDELLKSSDFLLLKRKLYNIQINLEATIDYYNSKISVYNTLKDKGPTNFSTKFFTFDEYNTIKNEKEEISRLINLN